MNALDYILDAVLLATVIFQFRGRRLTPRNLMGIDHLVHAMGEAGSEPLAGEHFV